MRPTHDQIAEAFSRHDFRAAYPYLADDLHWNVVGGEPLEGREKVVAWCDDLSRHLSAVTTTFSRFRLISAGDWVVVDSTASYQGTDGERSVVSACDLYRFVDGMLVEITSYNVELAAG